MKIKILLTLSLFFVANLITEAQNKEVKITSQKVADNIYILKGQGGNIGLFMGEDGVFMIDDQFAPLSKKIINKIKEITNKPLSYLINKRWHGDHTGGNENMKKEGFLIVAHRNVRKRMSVDQVVRGRKMKAASKEALQLLLSLMI